MGALDWIAAAVLFVLLPIPVYWLQIHPFAKYWRKRGMAAAFWTAGPVAAAVTWTFLFFAYGSLFAGPQTPLWAVVTGFALIAVAFYLFARVKQELGSARLIGKTELSGGGQLQATGLYARMRHPSYLGQMLTMLGACLLAWSLTLWVVAAVWLALLLVAIGFEERELAARFGDSYREYRRRVPAFLPFRVGSGREQSAAADHSSFRR